MHEQTDARGEGRQPESAARASERAERGDDHERDRDQHDDAALGHALEVPAIGVRPDAEHIVLAEQ